MQIKFTDAEYAEMLLLGKRLDILSHRWECVSDDQKQHNPDVEFTLGEVKDVNSLISTLRNIQSVYQ